MSFRRRPFRRPELKPSIRRLCSMSRSTQQLLAIVAVSAAAACSEVNVPSGDAVLLGPAFQTIPAGFSANSNSFDASGDAGEGFMPRDLQGIGFHGGPGNE